MTSGEEHLLVFELLHKASLRCRIHQQVLTTSVAYCISIRRNVLCAYAYTPALAFHMFKLIFMFMPMPVSLLQINTMFLFLFINDYWNKIEFLFINDYWNKAFYKRNSCES